MKQEASKKSKKWLWLVLGAVALLAAVGVVLALVLGGDSGDNGPVGGRPDLYWNVARESHLDPETNLSIREPAADGLYYVTFAYNGEQVEYAVADKKLVNYIDALDVMGLTFDDNGVIVDVIDPKEAATEVGKSIYVHSVSGKMLIANSSIVMNGMRFNINITDLTEVYQCSGAGEYEGVKVDSSAMLTMDTISVYANDKDEVTHIFITSQPFQSKVYWRKDFMWNWDTNSTSRKPDENGDYVIDFFCEGELLTFKCKDVGIVNKIDSPDRYRCHFALRFDEEGYIVEQLPSAPATRTLLQVNCFDVTEFDGENYTVTRLIQADGAVETGVLAEDCVIYDVSPQAIVEGRQGKQVETLHINDRVCIWTNVNGEAVLVYVTNTIVDSPAYWLPERKYDGTNKTTSREPNAQGWYEVELLKEGDKELTTYRTKDKDIMTQIDEPIDRCFGMKVGENNVIEYVYPPNTIFGNSHFRRGGYMADILGTLVTVLDGSQHIPVNGVLASDCKIYNVSKVGEYGAETELKLGDCVYAWKQPTGEICHMYVTSRHLGTENMYYCLDANYDNTLRTTKKVPDAEGWYYMTFANQGKIVTYKTKDVKIVNSIEYLAAPAVALVLKGDVIVAVDDGTAATGGPRLVRDYKVSAIDGNTITVVSDSGKTVKDIYLADDVEIYNVSYIRNEYRGEKSSIKIGDTVAVWADWTAEGKVVMITSRAVDNLYWKLDRYYSYNTNSTTRKPDADGWYWFEVTTNGEIQKVKTKDKSIANSADLYQEAFAMHVENGVIKGAVGAHNVKDCGGNGVVNWTVTAIKGNTVSLTYTLPGAENTGKTQTITLASNAKIYDVSASAKSFGEKTKLKVGDVIRTYLSEDKEVHQYVYIRGRSNREGGNLSYCDHCKQVVTWNPIMINNGLSSVDGHYYLCGDTTGTTQLTVATSKDDIEVVLDLNGYTFTNLDGRVASVREGDTLTILDSVGGGKMIGSCKGYDGGVVTLYGGGTVNLYGGSLELIDDENVKPYYGGVVYMYNSDTVFNMYGGAIRNGRAYTRNEKCGAYGGNVYLMSGTFNMYGGVIENGKCFEDTVTVTNKDGSTSEVYMRPYGGNIYAVSGAELNILGGTISGGWVGDKGDGGNIFSASRNNTVNISDATITKGRARRGGNFMGYGTGVWDNAVISDGYALDRGANVMFNRGNFTLDGGTKIVNGVAADRGGNMVIYYGNIDFNKCTVDGGVSEKGIGGNMLVLYDAKLNFNEGAVISNGNSATNGGNIYLQKNWDSDVMADLSPIVNVNGGEIKGGSATLGNGMYVEAGSVINLFGGNIADTVYLGGAATVSVSGNPTAADIFLGNNLLTLGKMTGGKVGITATGVFTKPVDNVADYVEYFEAVIRGGKVDYTDAGELTVVENINPEDNVYNKVYDAAVKMTADDVFAAGGTVTAKCPYCEEEVEWKPLEANTTGAAVELAGGHYYLAGPLNNNHRYTVKTSVCLHLNNNNITSTDRAFYVDQGTLNVMGDGEVKGSYRSGSNPHFGGTIDSIGNVNLFGGTWLRGNSAPVLGGRPGGTNATINIYEGTVIKGDSNNTGYALVSIYGDHTFNMWGGKITGGTWNGGTGGNIYIWSGTKTYYTGKVNIYGGTIENGNAAVGGNIYAVGDVSPLHIQITGGTITGGSVCVANNVTSFNVFGKPVIENLDLPNGSLVTLGKLETGANIKVSAEGIFTGALSNPDEYLTYISAFEQGMTVGKTAAGKLTIAYADGNEGEGAVKVDPNVCPCCGEDWSQITWIDYNAYLKTKGKLTNAGKQSGSGDVTEAGHYRLSADLVANSNVNAMFRMRLNNAGNIVFDLNGYTISQGNPGSSQSEAYVFYLQSTRNNCALYVVDTVGSGKVQSNSQIAPMIYFAKDNANSSVNIYGGEFTLLKSPSANGGIINSKAPVNIYGGIIKGGAVFANNAKLTINGGYIDGTVSAIGATAKLTVTGSPIISYLDLLSENAVSAITCNGLTDGALIRIAAPADLVFTRAFASEETAAKFANYFLAAGNAEVKVNEENNLCVVAKEQRCPHCGEAMDSITWNDWSFARATAGAITSGHYKLTANDSAASLYYIGSSNTDTEALDVCIDLNGYDLGSTNNRMFYIYSNHSLTVINSAANNATLTSKNNVDGGNVWVSAGATFKAYDCALVNNAGGSTSTNVEGGVISANPNSTVELVNCALTACNKGIEDGGILFAQEGSNVTLTTCVLSAKHVDKTGSAIAIDKGTVVLNNTAVIGGTAGENGGAIAMTSGTLTVNGGIIVGGKATGLGGAIYTTGPAKVNLNGCVVVDGVAAEDNGYKTNGIFGEDWPITKISDGTIIGTLTLKNNAADTDISGKVSIAQLVLVSVNQSTPIVVDISEMSAESTIGLVATADKNGNWGAFTVALTDNAAAEALVDCFTCGVEGKEVKAENGALVLVETQTSLFSMVKSFFKAVFAA